MFGHTAKPLVIEGKFFWSHFLGVSFGPHLVSSGYFLCSTLVLALFLGPYHHWSYSDHIQQPQISFPVILISSGCKFPHSWCFHWVHQISPYLTTFCAWFWCVLGVLACVMTDLTLILSCLPQIFSYSPQHLAFGVFFEVDISCLVWLFAVLDLGTFLALQSLWFWSHPSFMLLGLYPFSHLHYHIKYQTPLLLVLALPWAEDTSSHLLAWCTLSWYSLVLSSLWYLISP